VNTEFWWGNLRERDHFKDVGIDERIILKWIFKKWDGGGGAPRLGLICPAMGPGGGPLWMNK